MTAEENEMVEGAVVGKEVIDVMAREDPVRGEMGLKK